MGGDQLTRVGRIDCWRWVDWGNELTGGDELTGGTSWLGGDQTFNKADRGSYACIYGGKINGDIDQPDSGGV